MAAAATTKTPSTGRTAAAWLWDNRDPMAPLWCAAGAFISGAGVYAMPDHLWGLMPPAVYAVEVARRLERNHTKGQIRTKAAYLFHCAAAASFGIWMIPATREGITLTLAEAVGAGFAVFGGLWWLRPLLRRIRRWLRTRNDRKHGTPEPDVEPPARVLTPREQIVEDWETYLNVSGSQLAGVRLRDVEELAYGDSTPYAVRAIIEGLRGKHKTKDLVGMGETIRSGLAGLHGTVMMDGSALAGNCARLTVLTGDNPLRHLGEYLMPLIGDRDPNKTWSAPIGQFADGTEILWIYYTPGNGAHHGIIAGDTGSGKGVTTDKVFMGAVTVGAVVLFLDPKDGRSSSVLPLATGVAATQVERMLMLDGLEAEMRRRNVVMASRPWTDQHGNVRNTVPGTDPQPFFTPSDDMPLICVFMDEFTTQVQDEEGVFVKRLGPLAREARACGIGLKAIGQGVSAAETGGVVMRSQLAQNVAMMPTKNPLNGQRLGDGPNGTQVLLDPSELPPVWPGTSEAAKGLFVPAGLTAAGRGEMGRSYPNGNLVPIMDALMETRATLTPLARATLRLDELAEMRADRLAGRTRIQVPGSKGSEVATTATAQVPARDTKSVARDLVLQLLRGVDGELATGEILEGLRSAGCPMSPSALGNLMGELVDTGAVTRTRHGFYQAVIDVEVVDGVLAATGARP